MYIKETMEQRSIPDSLLFTWCDDLHQVKGNVSQIQATLSQILSKAPTVEEYREMTNHLDGGSFMQDSKQVVDRIKSLITSSQVKVAVRMRQLFDHGQLPLLLALSKINFKSQNADKFVGHLLDYVPPINLADSIPSALRNGEEFGEAKLIDLYSYPPQLPPISDDILMIRIFTDKSYRQPSDFLELQENRDYNRSHNSKLSIRGRSILELVMFELLDDSFPAMFDDEIFVLRHRLLSSTILAKLAMGYNLVDACKYNISQSISVEEKMEIFAKIFLSYVAGLSINGYKMDEIKQWINHLYGPIIKELKQESENEENYPVTKSSLTELQFLFQQVTNIYQLQPDQVKLEFEEMESEMFAVQIKIKNEVLGVGTSSVSIVDAKERAARDIMGDPQKLNSIALIILKNYRPATKEDNTLDSGSITPQATPQMSTQEILNIPIPGPPQPSLPPVPQSTSKPTRYVAPYTENPSGSVGYIRPLPYSAPSVGQPQPLPYNQIAPYGVKPYEQRSNGIDTNSKNTLYALLGQNHLAPVYKVQRSGNNFQSTVMVNETVLGVGYDTNKKIASQRAAQSALSNKTVLRTLGVDDS